MFDNVIRIIIEANDRASKTFAKVDQSVVNMRKGLEPLNGEMDKLQNAMHSFGLSADQSISNIRKEFEPLNDELGKLHDAMYGFGLSIDDSFEKVEKRFVRLRSSVQKSSDSVKQLLKDVRDNDRISRMFNDMSRSASRMSSQLDKAGDSLRKFGLGGAVLTVLPQLIVLLVQLGAQLVAVASSAGIAAAGLGAGLAAGVAQAVPAIGLLAVALKGLQSVMAAVKAANNDTAKSSAGVSDAADKQRAANDALIAAQERVKEAQRKLTEARKEARRELQDMVLDQEKARISAERTDLSLERARQSARKASVTGNLSDLADSTLDVREGKVDRKQSRLDVARGGRDLNKALAAGVEGSDKVLSARKELADATRDLDKAQREAAKSAQSMAVGSDAAATALAKLTPAQKRLFDAIMSIRKVAKEAVGGATEAITDGFTHAVKKAEQVLENIKVQRAMNRLGASIRDGFKTVTNMVSGPEGQKIFAGLTEAAAQNIPHVAKAIGNLSIAFGRLAMAGRPFVEWMIKGFERWSERVEKGSRNTKSLTHFFEEGQKHLKAWVGLLSSIIDLFLALGGAASGTGLKTVNDMSKAIRKTADNIRESKKETKQFWDTVYSLNGPMATFFKSLGKLMLDVFKGGGAESFKSFSKLMSDVLVPAMATVLKVTAQLTRILLKFLTLPFVSDIVKWGVVIAGLAFALAKFVAIMEVLGAIVGVVASAFGLLRAAVMAHPIIALITGLVVAIVLLDKKFHFLKPTLDWLMDALKWLGKGFLKLANIVGDAIGDMVRLIARGVKRIANWITDGPVGDALRWWARAWRRILNVAIDVLGDIVSLIRRVGKRIVNLFSDIWDAVKTDTKAAFSWILDKLGDFWGKFTDVVKDAAGGVKKAFQVVASGIKNIFVEIFKGIYNAVREVVNAIANGAAKIANLPGISSFAGGKIPKNPMPPYDKAFAEGGVVKAKPGGIRALIGEAGHDEVVLTTDPRHQNNTKRLLSMFLSRTGIMPDYAFAKGGYVQGANPPGSTTARMLANYMFQKGFSVTSAKDGKHAANSYHYKNGGSALDFGNSVNNLNSVWSVLSPMKAIFAELFGPKGLYHGSQKFSSPALQAQHNDHVHVATGSIGVATLSKALLGIVKGVGNSMTGGAISKLAPWIKKATKDFSGWVKGFIGDDPKNNNKIGPYKGLMHDIWGAYKKAIKKKLDEAKEKGSDDVDTSPAGGGLISWLTKALKITHKYSPMNLRLLKGRALQESGGDPKAQNNWDCLPVDSLILTRSGWKHYSEVEVGDETIGFNSETGKSEWTKVTGIHHYDDAELVEIGNKRWSVKSTPNHKWLVERNRSVPIEDSCHLCDWPENVKRTGTTTDRGINIHLKKIHGINVSSQKVKEYELVEAERLNVKKPYSVRVSAVAKTESRLNIDLAESEFLGWLLGDGHIRRKELSTHRGRPLVTLSQKKPEGINQCQAIIEKLPTSDVACYEHNGGTLTWALSRSYGEDLLERSNYANHEQMLLSMSTDQRAAFLRGVIGAEGTTNGKHTVIPQVFGDKFDVIQLAVFLDGNRPSIRDRSAFDLARGWSPSGAVAVCRPNVSILNRKPAGRGEVWCVTTDLGTWTAKQGAHIFLTGNSNAKAGHPSKGLLQTIDSTFNTYKMPGMNNIWNPIHNAVAAIRYMFARYGHIVGPSSTGYATGGELPGSEGSPINVLAHAGEMILNRSQQMALGGPAKLRRMFGFNPRTGKFATGGEVGLPDLERNAGSKALRSLDDPVSEFTSDLSKASKGLLKAITGNKGTKAILKIIRQMTSDEGPIALLLDSLSTMRDQFSAFIKKRRFTTSEADLSSEEAEKLNEIDSKIAREKKRRRPSKSRLNRLQKQREKILSQANVSEVLDGSDQSELELDELEKEGSTLAGARADVQADIDAVKRKLRAEKRKGKRKNKGKIRKYDAALNALEKSLNDVDSAIGDNLESRFQKQQEIIENQISEIGERADSRNSAIDIKRRLSTALGQLGNIPTLINEQISSVGQQVAELRTTLENAKKLGDQKLVEKVQKQIDDLNTSIVEMTIEKINAAVTAINTSAERQTAIIDRAKRVANATGNKSAIPDLLKSQLAIVQSQAKSIEGQAWSAHLAGNDDLRTQLDAQKNELKTQAVELVSEIFNASIDAVNSSAATSMSLIDTKSRMANIANLGRPDYASLGSLLSDKGSVLSTQKAELESLLSQAIAAGNKALTDSLNQSVLDLEAAINENTLAIEQNTVAALQFKIDNTNKSSNFLTGVADASSSIIKTIGEMMGEVDTGALLEYATSKGETLQSQGQSLKSYLDEFLGGTLGSSFTSATGTELVDMVNTIVSSTDLSGMITEEVDQFYSLIDAILSNEQAVQDNTSAIEDLEGSMNQQSFTTSAWEQFRQAIFNGSGQLLSAYDIPSMASGGVITKEGLVNLHAGERVLTTEETNNLGGNTEINVSIKEAAVAADPTVIAKTIAWELASSGTI